MDEIFEQMLSASSWGDGVGGMPIDSLGALQSLSKMGSIMPTAAHLLGTMENQGLPSHENSVFNDHEDHLQINNARALSRRSSSIESGLELPSFRQSLQSSSLMGGSWQEPFVESVLSQDKPGSFPSSGDGIPDDLHLVKRMRGDDENMKTGMSHGAQPQANEDILGQTAGWTVTNGTARTRVRARRGQATDPHSIAERNRRERIAERMKALQELVPDSNKTDKASMLDEIINYVKFLQLQVKCLSMCRLGGAGAAAPLLADLHVEGVPAPFLAANLAQANGPVGGSQEGIAHAERQVARLMDEDMSAAMQYLQSKGLCLMPISLATAISSTGQQQQATASKILDVSGSEKQAGELQALSASRSGSSIASLGHNENIDANDGSFAKSNILNISKESSQSEAVNGEAGLGLPPALKKCSRMTTDDDQR